MNIKGRTEFSEAEIDHLRELLCQLRRADRDQQKSIRGKMRKIGFYITDFTSISGFTEADLMDLVQSGQIKIVD